MKWTIECGQDVTTSMEVTYVVEADSAEEAERKYKLDGIITKSEFSKKKAIPLSFDVIHKIRPYLKSDNPDRYMVIVKYRRDKHIYALANDLTAHQAWKQAELIKDWLDVDDKKYEYISVMKQEPNMGTIFAYGD